MIIASLTALRPRVSLSHMAEGASDTVDEGPGVPEEPVFAPTKSYVSKADVYKALVASEGNISAAARDLGVRRILLQKVISETPEIQELLSDFREDIVDVSEDNIFKGARSGDKADSRFILQTIGKARGYSTAVEGTGKGGAITVVIQKFAEETPNG